MDGFMGVISRGMLLVISLHHPAHGSGHTQLLTRLHNQQTPLVTQLPTLYDWNQEFFFTLTTVTWLPRSQDRQRSIVSRSANLKAVSTATIDPTTLYSYITNQISCWCAGQTHAPVNQVKVINYFLIIKSLVMRLMWGSATLVYIDSNWPAVSGESSTTVLERPAENLCLGSSLFSLLLRRKTLRRSNQCVCEAECSTDSPLFMSRFLVWKTGNTSGFILTYSTSLRMLPLTPLNPSSLYWHSITVAETSLTSFKDASDSWNNRLFCRALWSQHFHTHRHLLSAKSTVKYEFEVLGVIFCIKKVRVSRWFSRLFRYKNPKWRNESESPLPYSSIAHNSNILSFSLTKKFSSSNSDQCRISEQGSNDLITNISFQLSIVSHY